MIKPLTSLRFIFAFMVFLNHLSFVRQGESEVWDWIFLNIFREGYIGVTFFFILSGFILAYNYQQKFKEGSVSKRQFWRARVARILPLYYLTFLAAIPYTLLEFSTNSASWIQKLLLNIFAVQSFIPVYDFYFSFNLPAWSLSNELFFYLLFPFLVPVVFKLNLKNSFLAGGGLLIILLFLIKNIDPINHHALFYINPFFRLIDFCLGIALFNLYKIADAAGWKNYKRASIREITSVFILLLFFILHPFIPEVYRFFIYYWLPMAMVVYAFAFQGGILSKWLSKKSLILLGEISFGFYLIHHLVVRYVLAINSKFFQISNEIFIVTSIFFITIIASYFTYYFFEIPCRNYIKGLKLPKPIHHVSAPLIEKPG
jgi:peptidoglycan/LPS O-acetylase OafA/YrhL